MVPSGSKWASRGCQIVERAERLSTASHGGRDADLNYRYKTMGCSHLHMGIGVGDGASTGTGHPSLAGCGRRPNVPSLHRHGFPAVGRDPLPIPATGRRQARRSP
jgi:hypothetical protein